MALALVCVRRFTGLTKNIFKVFRFPHFVKLFVLTKSFSFIYSALLVEQPALDLEFKGSNLASVAAENK